jgi:hypothetical protein
MTLGLTLLLTAQRLWRRFSNIYLSVGLGLALLLTGCSLPQVSAESRLFLNLSASFVADYTLPQRNFNNTITGGFSALTYDAQQNRIYALVDDQTNPRFYTLKLNLEAPSSSPSAMTVEAVTPLKEFSQATEPKPSLPLDSEGMALTHRGTVFIASEGNPSLKISPRLSEFEFLSGLWQQDLPLPKQYWTLNPDDTLALGVKPNHGFEAMTISAEGDRLFVATEAPLQQDASSHYSRFLHYWIGEPEPLLISEHLYPLNSISGKNTGLTDLIDIDNAGHFLSLERSYSPTAGYGAILYQLATGVATDTSGIRTLPSNLKGIVPILKQPLLNLAELNIPLQNLEGLTLGPRLQDGSRSLLLISDNHFNSAVPTQVLMLRLGKPPSSAKA